MCLFLMRHDQSRSQYQNKFCTRREKKKEVVLQFQILSIRRNRSLRNSRMKKRRIITQSVLAHKKVTLILNLYLLSVMLLRFNTLAIFVVSKDQQMFLLCWQCKSWVVKSMAVSREGTQITLCMPSSPPTIHITCNTHACIRHSVRMSLGVCPGASPKF